MNLDRFGNVYRKPNYRVFSNTAANFIEYAKQVEYYTALDLFLFLNSIWRPDEANPATYRYRLSDRAIQLALSIRALCVEHLVHVAWSFIKSFVLLLPCRCLTILLMMRLLSWPSSVIVMDGFRVTTSFLVLDLLLYPPPSVCCFFSVLNLLRCCIFGTSCLLLAEYPDFHLLTTDDVMVPATVLPHVQILVATCVSRSAARSGRTYLTAYYFLEHDRRRFVESTLCLVSAPSFPPSLEVDIRVCWPTVLDIPRQRSTCPAGLSQVLNQRSRPSLAPGGGCAASLTEMRISKNLPRRPARRRIGLAQDQGPGDAATKHVATTMRERLL